MSETEAKAFSIHSMWSSTKKWALSTTPNYILYLFVYFYVLYVTGFHLFISKFDFDQKVSKTKTKQEALSFCGDSLNLIFYLKNLTICLYLDTSNPQKLSKMHL